MKCPFCGCLEDKVLNSRSSQDGNSTRRRRECVACGRRYTTYEHIEEQPLMVVKHDGRREAFDRNKVLGGMVIAARKRPIGMDALNAIVDDIENSVHDAGKTEVASERIGEMVIESLRKLDEVAYVRFASVYRKFEDVGQFKEIIEIMEG